MTSESLINHRKQELFSNLQRPLNFTERTQVAEEYANIDVNKEFKLHHITKLDQFDMKTNIDPNTIDYVCTVCVNSSGVPKQFPTIDSVFPHLETSKHLRNLHNQLYEERQDIPLDQVCLIDEQIRQVEELLTGGDDIVPHEDATYTDVNFYKNLQYFGHCDEQPDSLPVKPLFYRPESHTNRLDKWKKDIAIFEEGTELAVSELNIELFLTRGDYNIANNEGLDDYIIKEFLSQSSSSYLPKPLYDKNYQQLDAIDREAHFKHDKHVARETQDTYNLIDSESKKEKNQNDNNDDVTGGTSSLGRRSTPFERELSKCKSSYITMDKDDMIHCKLCSKKASTPEQFFTHLSSDAHRKKRLNYYERQRVRGLYTPEVVASTDDNKEDVLLHSFYHFPDYVIKENEYEISCAICSVKQVSNDNMVNHLVGKRHITMINKINRDLKHYASTRELSDLLSNIIHGLKGRLHEKVQAIKNIGLTSGKITNLEEILFTEYIAPVEVKQDNTTVTTTKHVTTINIHNFIDDFYQITPLNHIWCYFCATNAMAPDGINSNGLDQASCRSDYLIHVNDWLSHINSHSHKALVDVFRNEEGESPIIYFTMCDSDGRIFLFNPITLNVLFSQQFMNIPILTMEEEKTSFFLPEMADKNIDFSNYFSLCEQFDSKSGKPYRKGHPNSLKHCISYVDSVLSFLNVIYGDDGIENFIFNGRPSYIPWKEEYGVLQDRVCRQVYDL